jgi:hypothetical protein
MAKLVLHITGVRLSERGSFPPTLAAASQTSGDNWFPILNIAYAKHLDANTVLGIGMYGNGGMNTRYNSAVFTSPSSRACASCVSIRPARL